MLKWLIAIINLVVLSLGSVAQPAGVVQWAGTVQPWTVAQAGGIAQPPSSGHPAGETQDDDAVLRIERDREAGTLSIFREDGAVPLVTQHARAGDRPYIHPIMAPDGNGALTQYRPEHHPHQTGLYWGLKEVNGRDYFMGWREEHYRHVSTAVVRERGPDARWRTVYDLLGEDGEAVLTETQNWSMRLGDGRIVLDLEWIGEARTDVTVGEFYVGGLFLRMPWHPGVRGDVVNAAGRRNEEAEGQRSMWIDVGMEIDGRSDLAHVAIYDHPQNEAFPVAWRVDGELGVGPSRQILGAWSLNEGERTTIRYRIVVYTGDRNLVDLTRGWVEYATGELR